MVHEVRIVLRLELPESGEIPPIPLAEVGQEEPVLAAVADVDGESDALPLKRVDLPTREGLKLLGRFLRVVRGDRSLDEFSKLIEARTGHRLSPAALSSLERGHGNPRLNTFLILAGSELLRNPDDDQVYAVEDLFLVACERLDPWTGEMV